MTLLVLAAVAWVVIHAGIAGTTVRGALAGRLGDALFRGIFSILSVGAIGALIAAYGRAQKGDVVALWTVPAWLGWVLVALMAAAFVLFVGSVATPNPTAVGGEKALGVEPRGLQRVTRHPMLWSFALWSLVHIVGNGNLAALVFFGAFGVTSLLGMPSIDRKVAARDPAGWQAFAAQTSIVPFAALAAGRTRLTLAEIGVVPLAAGLLLWAVLLYFHPNLFGVSPLPAG